MSEQAAGAPPADSRTIEQKIGAWFSTPKNEGIPPAPAPKQETAPEPEPTSDQVQEPTEATSEAPAETAPEFVEVEIEGKTYSVPPELKEKFIRQDDYTRKTQEVAEQRKLVEHQQAQLRLAAIQQDFEREIAPERQEISMLDYVIAERGKANWQQMSTDELVRARLELDQLRERKSAVEAEIGKKQQAHVSKLQTQVKEIQEQARSLVKQRIPQWDETTAKDVMEWGIAKGLTREEITSIYNPLHAEILWMARQYDKARNTAKPIVQTKNARPSANNPMPQNTKDMLNFRKAVQKTEGDKLARQKVVEGRIGQIFGKR